MGSVAISQETFVRRRSHYETKSHSCQTEGGNSWKKSARRSCWIKSATPSVSSTTPYQHHVAVWIREDIVEQQAAHLQRRLSRWSQSRKRRSPPPAISRWNTPLVRGRIRMMPIPAHSRALRMTEAASNAAHCCVNHSDVGKGRCLAASRISRFFSASFPTLPIPQTPPPPRASWR